MPKNQRAQAPSSSEDLTNIIKRYSSPVSSSSPVLNRQPYDSIPRPGDGDDSFMSLPSSAPLYESMSTPPLPTSRHRRTSTNSGYLSRAELFGRTSPAPSNEIRTTSSSSALERIETRRQQGCAAPEYSTDTTRLGQTPQTDERVVRERSSMRSLRVNSGRSSTPFTAKTPLLRRGSTVSLREAPANDRFWALSTPDMRSSRLRRRGSAMSMRSGFADTPQDEWMEAGTPVHKMESSCYGPEPTVASNREVKFHVDKDRSSVSGARFFSNKTSSTRSDRETSKVSPAQSALHQTLGRSASPVTPPVRKPSWTHRLFGRTARAVAPRPTPPSPISDDNVSEFEYIEPRSPTESPETIVERIRARESALHSGASAEASEPSQASNPLDGSYIGERSSIGSICECRPHEIIGEMIPSESTASSSAAFFGPVEELSANEDQHSAEEQPAIPQPFIAGDTTAHGSTASSRPESLYILEEPRAIKDENELDRRPSVPTLPHEDATCFVRLSEVPCLDEDHKSELQPSAPSSPQSDAIPNVLTPTSNNESPTKSDNTNTAAQPLVSTAEMESSPAAVVHDRPPVQIKDTLALSSPVVVLDQPAQDPQQELVLGYVKETISQSPAAPTSSRSLSFATANAILYACTTFAALQHVLSRIGEEVRSIDLVSDMGVAVVIGVVVCAFTHNILNGRVEQARRLLM